MVRDAMAIDSRKKKKIPIKVHVHKIRKRIREHALQVEEDEDMALLMSTVNIHDNKNKDQQTPKIKIRCAIHQRCPSPKPIDLLTQHLLDDEPYHAVFEGLTAAKEMEQLRDDIKNRLDLH